MKLFYTSLLLFLAPLSQAQITIDLSDMPVIGDVINRKADTMTVLSGPGNAGANQTWNFTQTSTYVNDETSTAVAPSTTPYASQFSSSNLALTDGNGGYVFFNQSASSILVKGIAGAFPGTTTTIVAHLNPDQTLHNLPRTYGSNFSDEYKSDVTISGSSISPLINQIRVKRTGLIKDTTDAWGTLTTPNATYDVLRVKKVDFTTDSVWVQAVFPPTWQLFQTSQDTVTTYQWLAKDGKLPIAELTFDSLGAPKIFRWSLKAPLSVNELLEKQQISIYPNPANNNLTINGKCLNNGNTLIQLFDLQGRMVYSEQKFALENNIQIITSTINEGIYVLLLTDENKRVIFSEKLNIRH
jgi:hypothetical protein